MDVSFIDITDVPEATVGDVVTIFGQDGGTFQSIFEIANLYPGTAPEITTMLGRRVPRFYLRDGDVVGRDSRS
jgi:alanine racemase